MPDDRRDYRFDEPAATPTPMPKPDAQVETGPLAGVTPSGTIVDSRLHAATPCAPIGFGTDRYELREEIARGGMGAVFRAWDRVIKREVAVKVVLERQGGSDAARRRFYAEAATTGQLQHPGIPPVHDLGTLTDGRPFMAMKLIRGRTFSELLKARPSSAADLSHNLQIFEAICQTVAFAHAQGVIHRDLKPQNIMVGAFAEVQVMDWGLSKEMGSGPWAEGGKDADDPITPGGDGVDRTHAGAVLGTPAYMPPEQARGEIDTLGPAADVFALGAILCQILTEAPPHAGHSTTDILQRAAAGDMADACARLDSCKADAELIALAKRCLASRTADRYRDAGELAVAFAAFRQGVEERLKQVEMERARTETQAAEQRKRRKVQMALAVSVLALLMGGGIVGWWYDHQASKRRLENELRSQTDHERLANNAQAMEIALDQTEEALRIDDALKAAIPLEQAEKRMVEEVGEVLQARFERCRKDLAMLRELDRINDSRWKVVHNKLPDATELASKWSEAFNVYGIAPDAIAPDEAARRINASLIRDQLLIALDAWLSLEPTNAVAAILTAADPDSYRESIRRASQADDLDLQRTLAARPEATEQPARFALVLGQLPSLSIADRARHLSTCHRQSPGNFMVLMALGELYPTNQVEGAVEQAGWYRAALAVRPTNVVAWSNLGNALHDMKNLDEAVAAYKEAIRLEPNYTEAHFNLGVVLRDKSDRDGAVAEFKLASRLDPKDATAHANLGIALFDKNDRDGAIAEYQEAIRLDPKDAPTHANLGIALFDKNDRDGAIAEYKEAIRLNPKDATAHANLGVALFDKNDRDGAIAEYKEAIRLDPKSAEVYTSLGTALSAAMDVEGAIAAYKEAIRLDPKDAVVHYNLGNVLRDKKDPDGAIAQHREAIRLDPKYAEPRIGLGAALYDKNDLNGAIASYKEAIRLDPKLAVAHGNLGGALYAKKDMDGAIAAYKDAIRLDPMNAWLHYSLGVALGNQGRFVESKEELAAAQKLLPPIPLLLEAIQIEWGRIDQLLAAEMRLPAVLAAQAKPANAVEAIRFAELCARYQKRYPLSLRFYAEAFRAESKLETNPLLGHRYNAACYAALAADGKGIEPPPTSERPELRRTARDWLAADLAARTQLLDSAPEMNRAVVHGKMLHWLADPDLAGIRDPDKLKTLHPDEQRIMEILWRDVRTLRDRTAPPEQLPLPKAVSAPCDCNARTRASRNE